MKKTNLECSIALHNPAFRFCLVFTDWFILKPMQVLESHKYAAPQNWRSDFCDCNADFLLAKLSSLGSNSACFTQAGFVTHSIKRVHSADTVPNISKIT